MKKTFAALAVLYLFALVLALSGNTYALPEYGVRYGQSCQLCHYSVTGAGARTLYGAQFFSYTDLPANPLDFDEIAQVNPMISDNLQAGFDFRTFYYVYDETNLNADQNSFLTMQGDIYLTWQAGDRTIVAFDKGLRNTFEAYVQTQALPGAMAAKMGRFMPNYGWRFADHTAYVRQFTGFGGTQGVGGEEDGFEIGHFDESWELSAAVTNGPVAGPVDSNQGKAFTSRAAKRYHFGNLGITLGGSYRYAEFGNGGPPNRRMAGAFYGLNVGKWTLLGEVDGILTDAVGSPTTSGYVTTNVLRFDMKKGIAAHTSFDYYEPDLDFASGQFMRGRLGVDYTPYGYVTLTPILEYSSDPTYEGLSAQFHVRLWY